MTKERISNQIKLAQPSFLNLLQQHTKNALYFLNWYTRCRYLGNKNPLLLVFSITSQCNLKCKHCAVWKQEVKCLDFDSIERLLRYTYDLGCRIVFFEGGEPMLWTDRNYSLEDVVRYAKSMGFFRVAFSTNGTFPIKTSADLVSVSIDGLKKTHDSIRGTGIFDRAVKNLQESNHQKIFVNVDISLMNWEEIEDLIRFLSDIRQVKGVSVNFHTPLKGVEQLALPFEFRKIVIEKIVRLKQEGYPIINSFPGLKALAANGWIKARACWISMFVLPDGKLTGCPGQEEKVCENCGYGMGAEFSLTFSMNLSSIKSAFNLFQ